MLIVGATVAIAAVVALTATAVVLIRRDAGAPRPDRDVAPAAVAGQAPARPADAVVDPPRAADAPAEPPRTYPAVVRAVPKVPPRPVDSADTTRRPNRRSDRAAANVANGRPAAVAPAENRGDTPPSAADEQRQHQLERLARDMIEGLKATGETGGLAAFPPPGTVPIKVGLVVPDDFVLPDGYVRYYQNTDDGVRLEPILMFSPDYEFVDADGKPVALPKDGVVPPELAPPGMPQRTLEVPKTRTAVTNPPRPGG